MEPGENNNTGHAAWLAKGLQLLATQGQPGRYLANTKGRIVVIDNSLNDSTGNGTPDTHRNQYLVCRVTAAAAAALPRRLIGRCFPIRGEQRQQLFKTTKPRFS